MLKRRRGWLIGLGLSLVTALAVACAPAADPTATTAPQATAAPAATKAPAPAATKAPTTTTTTDSGTSATDPKGKAANQPMPVVKSPDPNPNAKTGGVYRYAAYSWPADFSGWEGAASEARFSAPFNDTLMEYNAYEKGKRDELIPNVAYDWWVSNDGLTWTFKLTEGIKFHDGVEFTCADAEFMLLTMRTSTDATGSELRRSPRAKSISRINDQACVDDYTLQVDTTGPMPSLPSTLATGYFQLRPKHVFEGNLDKMMSAFGPGMGPYMEDSYLPGEKLTYQRNPNYWNQPYPYLDGVEYTAGTRTSAYAALRVGRVEFGYTPGGSVQLETDKGFLTPYESSAHGGRKFQVNWTREPWNKPQFAKAVQCALDGEKFLNTAYSGIGIFHLGVWPPDSPWSLPLEEVNKIHPCVDKSTPMSERQEIARGLLAEIGITADNPARPYIPIWDSCYGASFPSLQEDLEAVNIMPETTQFESGRAYDIAYSGEFDAIPWCFISPRFDPDGWLYEHYYSTSDRNYGKYTNLEVDAMIDLQSVTIDPDERLQIVQDISRQLLTDGAKVILYHYRSKAFHAPWVMDFNFVSPSTGSATDRFTRIWIDKAKKDALGK